MVAGQGRYTGRMSDDHNPDAPDAEHGCTDPNSQITKEAIGSLLVPAGITPSPGATVEELTAMVDDAQKSGLDPGNHPIRRAR